MGETEGREAISSCLRLRLDLGVDGPEEADIV